MILFVMLSLIFSGLIYFNYTKEQQQVYTQLQLEEYLLRQDLNQNYINLKRLTVLTAAASDLKQVESNINNYLPRISDLSNLLIAINQLAAVTQVIILSLVPDTKAITQQKLLRIFPDQLSQKIASSLKNGKITVQIYQLQLKATYPDFLKFIYKIAPMQPPLLLTNLYLQQLETNKLSIICDLVVFYSS